MSSPMTYAFIKKKNRKKHCIIIEYTPHEISFIFLLSITPLDGYYTSFPVILKKKKQKQKISTQCSSFDE